MKRSLGLVFAFTTAFATAAIAAPHGQRIRGTIKSVNHSSLAVHSRHGKNVPVKLNHNTKYAYVVKSSLSKIDPNTYIGVATHKVRGSLIALEVAIFPQSMRGMGEGHYPWDQIQGTVKSGGGMTSSKMTNGNVKMTNGNVKMTNGNVKMTNGHVKMTNGNVKMTNGKAKMTNGNVKSSHGQSGAKVITVSYNGKQKRVVIPPSAPIVAFQKASKSALKKGAHVFIMATKGSHPVAKFVAVGKNGLKPPM
jgi:hypothetical protein